jgi:hypothetical protein
VLIRSAFGKGEKDENCNYDRDDASSAIVFADVSIRLAAGGLRRFARLRRVRRFDKESNEGQASPSRRTLAE